MLARHVPYQVISRRFGLGISSLFRHRQRHIAPLLKGVLALDVPADATPLDLERLRRDRSESLLQRLVHVQSRIIAEVNQAESDGDLNTAERLWGRYLKAWEAEARMLGELGAHTRNVTTNIIMAPMFVELTGALLGALAPYPEARTAAASVLHGLQARAIEGAVDAGRAA